MVYPISVAPYTIKSATHCTAKYGECPNYNLFTIDKESYICNSVVENSDEGHIPAGRLIHNLQIGRYCSLAFDIYFLIGRGKDYSGITTSAAKIFQGIERNYTRHHEKGSVIIQNDVWIGRKASVMSGVTIHNGAIVAAMSHVVKDVPPYAIVGGNPARVIGYRFDEDIIRKLQTIQWWYWPEEKLEENAHWFGRSVEEFCEHFYPAAQKEVEDVMLTAESTDTDRYFMLMEPEDNYPVISYLIEEFLMNYAKDATKELILYNLPGDAEKNSELEEAVEGLLADIVADDSIKCSISLETGDMERIKRMLPTIKHLITNRRAETVQLMCYAELYGNDIEMISGVDNPIFD